MIMRATEKIIAKIALPTIAIAAALIIVLFVASARATNNESNAYIRVINCIISIPATERTQNDIENCYINVERDLDVELKRYDTSGYRK